MYDLDPRTDDNDRASSLLLEIVKRAAYDWALYSGSRRLTHRRLARDAFIWLFVEKPGHPDWVERQRSGWAAFSFLAICEHLNIDPVSIRRQIRNLTPRRVQAMGRPATTRRVSRASEDSGGDVSLGDRIYAQLPDTDLSAEMANTSTDWR